MKGREGKKTILFADELESRWTGKFSSVLLRHLTIHDHKSCDRTTCLATHEALFCSESS